MVENGNVHARSRIDGVAGSPVTLKVAPCEEELPSIPATRAIVVDTSQAAVGCNRSIHAPTRGWSSRPSIGISAVIEASVMTIAHCTARNCLTSIASMVTSHTWVAIII
jgi:hypothetical protein